MTRRAKQEIEIKLRVGDAAEMRRRLRAMGAREVRQVHEMNTLFDTARATLRKHGQLLRLREETTLLGKRQKHFVLTFKGPAKRSKSIERGQAESPSYLRYKVREEMEYILGEPQAFLALAGQAEMRPSFRYEKFRTSYRVPGAGGVHVEFDETPAGVFLELEGPRRGIDRMARRLGYAPGEYITRSYAALHFEACRRRGIRARDMMFGRRNAGRG